MRADERSDRVLAAHEGWTRIDWGSLAETLTGEELSGDELLAAAILLAIGICVSFFIGRRRPTPEVDQAVCAMQAVAPTPRSGRGATTVKRPPG